MAKQVSSRAEICCMPLAAEPIGVDQAGEVAIAFKALSDPVRVRLLSLIASHPGGEAYVNNLIAAFDLTGPTISHHLRVLREAGLIGCQRRGTWVYYWVVPTMLERLSEVLSIPAGSRATD
ncbi:ArsR/SmtB family transcription factor [Herbidospora mongoliensis]|uniref:ArsR/SmtB family transcription factor n=1 Tax=Herbidospora mongoliensis TaxID=688067 RepID=UPI000835FA9A|nr:metalloregulator ArsR/SmtB family transcription factor [Herbidospora mongoliensis]